MKYEHNTCKLVKAQQHFVNCEFILTSINDPSQSRPMYGLLWRVNDNSTNGQIKTWSRQAESLHLGPFSVSCSE